VKLLYGMAVFFAAIFIVACGGANKIEDRETEQEVELLCKPEQIEDIDFRILNTDTRVVLEQNSVSWKMLDLGKDEESLARNVSTAFLNKLNVPLSNVPEWFTEMREEAVKKAVESGEPVDYGFLNEALDRFLQDPKYSQYRDPEQKFKLFQATNEGFIRAMGDPFAVYITPSMVESVTSYTGTYYGIGSSIRTNENNEWELSPIGEGNPAELAGIKRYDVLLEVDGKSVAGCLVWQIVENIKGKKGSKVKLTIERDGKEIEFIVPRGEVKIEQVHSWPHVEWDDGRGSSGKELSYSFPLKTRDGKEVPEIAYIKLDSFELQPAKDFYHVLANMPWENVTGLIIDLRNNPGGLVSSGISTTGYFLEPNAVIFNERNAEGDRSVHRNPPEAAYDKETGLYFIPNLVPRELSIVLLVNQHSYSAAELFSGALQDHGRAVLVGERTGGKGTVNMHFLLKKGEYGALYIAIRLWETPNGRFIEPLYETEKGGLLPNVVVEQPVRGFSADNDENIFRALEILTEGK